MVVRPAPADHGIWFRRTDHVRGDALVPAIWSAVAHSALCTRIENAAGVSVSTIEHIMAALAGCGVGNALIDIDGPEVPILDGSAAGFVRSLIGHGFRTLNAPIRALQILRPVDVTDGPASARLVPADGLWMDFAIDFEDAAIGRQRKALDLANGSFVRDLCDSRTFCRSADVDRMRAAGLALGGTLNNAVVVDGADVLTPGGLRHADEAVRHKMLDALGDLYTAGAPVIGAFSAVRGGHALTNRLLRAVFADPRNSRIVECTPSVAARLPGMGVHHADLPAVA